MPLPAHPVFAAMNRATTDVLGEPVTVALPGGDAVVRARFRGLPAVAFGEVAQAEMAEPRITFVAADVPGLADGTLVTIAGTGWTVRDPMPDGRGKISASLEAA